MVRVFHRAFHWDLLKAPQSRELVYGKCVVRVMSINVIG